MDRLEWLYCLLIIVIILNKKVFRTRKRKKTAKKPFHTAQSQTGYAGLYTRVPLLTQREQKQYELLKRIADEKNALICPKVRLLDLVTPVQGARNYKSLMSKVMSKHVDFVICNQEMYVLGIIELDDRTHLRQDRIERDEFVDTVLQSAGYRIKHVWEIRPDILDDFVGQCAETIGARIISPTGWVWNESTQLWDPPEILQ